MLSAEDKKLVEELGLTGFNEPEQAKYLLEFYEAFETKVGMALSDRLSEDQLKEFGKIEAAGDDDATEKWLRQVIPDYDEVIAAQMAELKQLVKQEADGVKAGCSK
jgi:hypothetical protein